MPSRPIKSSLETNISPAPSGPAPRAIHDYEGKPESPTIQSNYNVPGPGLGSLARGGKGDPCFFTHLECARCEATHDCEKPAHLCGCGGPLLVRYDLNRVRETVHPAEFGGREPSLWRYRELLPLREPDARVSLGEPMTPLLRLHRVGAQVGLSRLYMKDEGLLPTGTFKARGAAVGVSRARELGVEALAMPTNGNAGAAWAAYSAAAGIECVIVMPTDAPLIHRKECAVTGADLLPGRRLDQRRGSSGGRRREAARLV